MGTINDSKCLASWAVFKQLCDEGHKNIYDVLRDFIKASIYRHGLRSFTSSSLTDIVNKDYEFTLKIAVVVYALQDMGIKKNPKNGEYECEPLLFAEEADLDSKIDESNIINNRILDGLFSYYEHEIGTTLNDYDKESIVQSLISYLLNNTYEDEYSTIISAYIIRCRNNEELAIALDNILEGVVRYIGISFDSPALASDHWTNKMIIYLDTEILFHMAGYNGSLYQHLFYDFFDLVNEVNTNSRQQKNKKLISLRYFDYVAKEIDTFFEKAIEIVNGQVALNPSVTAMKEITVGCKTESEVTEKKGLFLTLIKDHGIELESEDSIFYCDSKFAYNLEDNSIIDGFCQKFKEFPRSDIYDSLLSLSHVNVLRRGISQRKFEDLGYILLTDNYITEKLAWSQELKKVNDQPLCTNLYFITNRIWYRLGKAFGNSEVPKVFDVISKAQIILSKKINKTVYTQYEKLIKRLVNKEINSEGALEVLYQLRNQVKNPEEIDTKEDVDDAMVSVGERDLQKYIEESEYRKAKLQQTEVENKRLSQINEQVIAQNEKMTRLNESVRLENENVREENEKVKAENNQKGVLLEETNRKNAELKDLLNETRKAKYASDMELYKKNLGDYVHRRKNQTKWLFFLFFFFLASSIGIAILVNKFDTWTNCPDWIKTALTILLGQVFPVIRSYITKINIKTVWRVLFRSDSSIFEGEYRQNNPEPVLLKR